MKLSEAVLKRLSFTDGGGLEFGRDSRGLFVRWDRLEINLELGVVKLYAGKEVVGVIHVDNLSTMKNDPLIVFNGLEGVCRLTIN